MYRWSLPLNTFKPKQLRLLGWLLLALVPLLAVAGALIWRVHAPSGYQWFAERDKYQLCWSARRGDRFWCLNALSGELTEQPRFTLESVAPSMPDGNRYFIETKNYSAGRWQGKAIIGDPQSGKILREIPLDLPEQTSVVGNRYLVSMDARGISALDLTDPKPAPIRLTAPLAGKSTWIVKIPGKTWFWRVNDSTKPGQVEVFEVSERSLQKRFSWPVGTLGHRTGQVDDVMFCITPDNQHIERRSLASGELLQTIKLPSSFDSRVMDCAFRDGLFVTLDRVTKQQTFYDPIKNEQLRLPNDRLYLAASSPSGRLRLFFNDSDGVTSTRYVVYDVVAGSVLFDNRLPRTFHIGWFLPDNHLMLASTRYGISTYVIDLDSGEVTHRQSPFRWVAWAMPLLVFSFLGWAIVWMRISSRAQLWVWCDVALLSALVLLPLILRLFAVERRTDLQRLPYDYCHGIFLGLFQMSIAWLIFGNTRLTLRYLPSLLVLTALVMALTCVLGTDSSAALTAVAALVTTMVLVLAMSVMSGIARLGGWRLMQSCQSEAMPLPSRERISMRDPFIALTCFALAAAALRPLAPYLWTYNPDNFPVDVLAIHIASSFAALMFALTSRSIVFRLGMVAFVLLSAAIVAQPTYDFVVGWQAGLPLTPAMVYFRAIGTAALATYLFALAFRFRSWRLMRSTAIFSALRSPRPPR